MANRILYSGYDVIVIQEVWWDEIETILREGLRDVYPYYVMNISNEEYLGGDFFEEGSGLNIYSKLPFVPIAGGFDAESRHHDYDIGFNSLDYQCPDENEPKCGTYFAFVEYDAQTGGDSWAAKGVGHVRVQNPDTERRHNVFFSHMQATYSDQHKPGEGGWHGYSTRTKQFEYIRNFVLSGTVGDKPIVAEDVFLVGDLNVDGDLSNPHNVNSSPYDDNLWEWTSRFDRDVATDHDEFFAGGNGNTNHWVHDTWRYEHPIASLLTYGQLELDYGRTGSFGNIPKRLDYIMSNTGAWSNDLPPLCNQHPQLARNLLSGTPLVPGGGANPPGGRGQWSDGQSGVGAPTFQSDHLGVNAHYNRLAPHCSPLLPAEADALYGPGDHGARVLGAAEVGNQMGAWFTEVKKDYEVTGPPIDGKLEYPGSVQWYFLPWDGAYNIGVDADADLGGYQVQVYAARDLSVPYKAYGSKDYPTVGGSDPPVVFMNRKYPLKGGPFFIKVFNRHHDHRSLPGSSSGEYKLNVNRLGCTNKEADACPLWPNMEEEFEWPAGGVSSFPSEQSLYFDLAVESFTKPAKQELDFDLFGHEDDVLAAAIVEPDDLEDHPINVGATLLRVDGQNGQGPSGDPCSPSGPLDLPGCNLRIATDLPNPQGESRRLIWRVYRPGEPSAQTFSVRWSTELTVAYGAAYASDLQNSTLVCVDKTDDDSPHDEIDVRFKVDGEFMVYNGVTRARAGRYKKGRAYPMDGLYAWFGWPWRYKNELEITLIEDDDGDDDESESQSKGPLGPGWGPFSFESKAFYEWHWEDGIYRQEMRMNHGLQSHSAP
ncbi:MAG: endonuclease/exonuclease/phosphatase family protein [Myxococcota bacterium]